MTPVPGGSGIPIVANASGVAAHVAACPNMPADAIDDLPYRSSAHSPMRLGMPATVLTPDFIRSQIPGDRTPVSGVPCISPAGSLSDPRGATTEETEAASAIPPDARCFANAD